MLDKWINYILRWRARYFIIHEGILYYSAKKGAKLQGTVHLNVCSLIPQKNKRRVILNTGTTTLHLRAKDQTEMQNWISAIKKS